MANIFLTRKCNLKCPYCFADEFVNKANEEITLENFKFAVDYIKKDKNERLGLIGGEPMLHPQFGEFLDIILNDEEINNIVIYTNGILIDKYIDKLLNPKIHMLINCNSIKDIGEINFNKLRDNIILLKDKNKESITLGINIYSDKMDYSYIFELLKLIDAHNIRFSTALPNTDKEKTRDVLEKFKKMKPFLFKFFSDCYENKIIPTNDCNAMPDCIFTIDEKKLLLKICELSKNYNVSNTIHSAFTCNPVIDIMPDLTAVRCFGLSKYIKLNIKDYKNIANLRNSFFNQIDVWAKLVRESDRCENCKSRLINKCGICYTYKIQRSEDLKKLIKKRQNKKFKLW